MLAEGNKWLGRVPNKHRNVEFCIISLLPDATPQF
jgi:hypothetical protein